MAGVASRSLMENVVAKALVIKYSPSIERWGAMERIEPRLESLDVTA